MKEVERPAIVHEHVDLDMVSAEIKDAFIVAEDHARKGAQHYALIGSLLIKAKAAVGHGGWLNWVKKNLPFAPDRAAKCMRLANQSPGIDLDEQWKIITGKVEKEQPESGIQTAPTSQAEIETVVDNPQPVQQSFVPEPTTNGHALPKGWKKCGLCKTKPSRDSSKCSDCKALNEAPAVTKPPDEKPPESGPDQTDYIAFWSRTGKTLGKRLKQMNTALAIPKNQVEEARKAYGVLSKFIANNAQASPRPQQGGTCKKCGAEIVWTTTDKHSRIALEPKPGGGVWEVIDGVAHYCEWDKDAAKYRFRCHSQRCVSNKPIPE